ncbi:MAG: glycosyltransferase [Elusimicrobia bacterium]|nr:glycosyltransferase [Elusimicrobiota bacterium]
MKILYVVGFFPEVGGPFASNSLLIKYLVQKGVNCHILSPIPSNYDNFKIQEIKKNFDVQYYQIGILDNFFSGYSNEFKKCVFKLVNNTDIIHLQGAFTYYSYFICKFVKNKPIVLSPRGALVKWGLRKNFISRIKKFIYLKTIGKMILNSANIIHFTSEYEKKEFENFFGKIYDDKIAVIPNGVELVNRNVDADLFRKRLSIEAHKKIVLFMGRISREKNLESLILAFSKLSKKHKDLMLVIAGPDEKKYKQKLDWLIGKQGIEDRVVFTGMIEGELKWSAYKAAEVFVLPSWTENFGMVAVEAMSSGIPIVVSNMVGIADDIKKFEAGYVSGTDEDSI